jgi:hypothetical protein
MKKYFCIKDYIMTDGSIAYKAGEDYMVKEYLDNGFFVLPSKFDIDHLMNTDEDFFEYFIDLKKEQKKVLKRLLKHSTPDPKMFLDEFLYGIEVNEPEVVDTVVESVINQFKQRSEVGFKKYGTNLDREDLNALEWLQHLQEELMDACLYVEKLKKQI